MQIIKRADAVKRFQLSDPHTSHPLVVIEAENEEQAVERCRLIAHEIHIDDHDLFEVAEHPIGSAITVAFYADSHFLVLEAAGQTVH